MTAPSEGTHGSSRPTLDDCWNRIGVRGDRSCPRLLEHIHCRNCPVHAAAAEQLLHIDLPAGYQAQSTQHLAEPLPQDNANTYSAILFRVGAEGLALPSRLCIEIADTRVIHSLPHQRNPAVMGVTTIRGELLVCVSLALMLGIETQYVAKSVSPAPVSRQSQKRLLVMHCEDQRIVFPVDSVLGIHRYVDSRLSAVPVTIAKSQATYTKAMLRCGDYTVACLDEQLLFYTLNRRLG